MILTDMTRDALIELRVQIDTQLEKLDVQRKQDALKAVAEAAEKYGFSLDELATANRLGRRSGSLMKGVAKYAHPDDKSKTWTGKGRKPKWFDQALAAGITPEQMEI